MDKPIDIGDLVMIVRGHECCVQRYGGIPFVVTGIIRPTGGGYTCQFCKKVSAWGAELSARGIGKSGSAPLSWLIKIDPPALPESVEREKELTI